MNRQDAGTPESGFPEPDEETDRHTSAIVAAAVEVHRHLGPGFLESVYENALCVELGLRGVSFQRQLPVAVTYKTHSVGDGRIDLLVAGQIVVELKAVESLDVVHVIQVRSYLKATGRSLGILINFNVPVLLRGVRRVILTPRNLASRRPCICTPR
jgi:GxxExxY protein